jgi:hypothetical protein
MYKESLSSFSCLVNYALRQTARLSSLHISAGGTAFTAINGIDGDRGSLMHTEINPFPSWWNVDLGKVITVNAVTIYSLISSFSHERSRIADFSIRIGFAETSDDENYENCVGHILGFGTPETRTLFCTKPARGRYVTIISHVNDYFHLSEVYVHGEEIGKYYHRGVHTDQRSRQVAISYYLLFIRVFHTLPSFSKLLTFERQVPHDV